MTKPSFAVEAVHDSLISRLGPVTGLRRLTEGMESQAFAFRRGGEEFVLRINRDQEGFLKERIAHDRFATAKLPIPEVIDIGPFDYQHAYCVSRLLPGITLQDMTQDVLAVVLAPTADVLAALAESDLSGTSGYGPWDRDGLGLYGSWREFMLEIPNPGCVGVSGDRMPEDLVEHIHRYADEIRRWADRYPEERRLVHGDFGSNNILAVGQVITGVIDWSESMYGDPLYDVVNIFFWRTWLPCMEARARHFEKTGMLNADSQDRMRCYALRIGVQELLETSSRDVATWAATRCDQLMVGQL